MVSCRDCRCSGVDDSPIAGLRSNDLETRRQTILSLGLSDDAAAFAALRSFQDKKGALIDPVREDVQLALRKIRDRAIQRAPVIEPGMRMDKLVTLLGPPFSGETGSEILGRYGHVMGSEGAVAAFSARGYFMFRHPAGDYGVVVSNGIVEEVNDFPYV